MTWYVITRTGKISDKRRCCFQCSSLERAFVFASYYYGRGHFGIHITTKPPDRQYWRHIIDGEPLMRIIDGKPTPLLLGVKYSNGWF